MATRTRKTVESRTARPGMTFIVIGPFCWGKDTNDRKALANAKKSKPSSITNARYELFEVPEDAWVDGMGRINWSKGGYDNYTNHGLIK